MLGHKTRLGAFKRTEIMQSMFSDHNKIVVGFSGAGGIRCLLKSNTYERKEEKQDWTKEGVYIHCRPNKASANPVKSSGLSVFSYPLYYTPALLIQQMQAAL